MPTKKELEAEVAELKEVNEVLGALLAAAAEAEEEAQEEAPAVDVDPLQAVRAILKRKISPKAVVIELKKLCG